MKLLKFFHYYKLVKSLKINKFTIMFEDKEYFIPNDNGLILVEGEDRFSFIQGIISNDIEILKKNHRFIPLC